MEGALLSPDYMLLDGDNMCHRRFHALHRFSSSDGLPTGMVFGMVNSIFSFQLAFPNAKFIACFDKFGSQGKNTTSFQQKRPRKPPAFYLQMRILREILPHMGVACVDKPGYEADQLLATLAKRLPGDKLIVSEDKDLAQCVTPHVRLYQKPNKKWVQIDEAAVIERYGVPPKKIADYLALAGDPADNIPGYNYKRQGRSLRSPRRDAHALPPQPTSLPADRNPMTVPSCVFLRFRPGFPAFFRSQFIDFL